jgi:glycosyltransferase involved in cell wall biosynthesis
MRIGMLLDRTFPPDPRVANEARSLTAAGHEVHLLCLRHGSRQAEREEWQGVHVHRVGMPRWFYRKFSAVSLDVPLYRWSLLGPLRRMVAQERIEVIHTHDLPMVAIGRAVTRSHGLPLVADLHENWPAALATYGYVRRFPGRILISPARWARHERRILPGADRIVVVIEEARDRLIEMGIEPRKIVVVRNTVAVDEFRGFGIDPSIGERFRGRYVLCYLGGFERHRGLEMVVEAMPQLARLVPNCLLLLIGSGSTEAGLRSMAERLGIADRVVFEGWQPFQRFPSYIQAADVCLIPHVRNDHTDTTIPHKLFQTMLLGRPVLTSDCRPLRRIVEETGCGLVVPSGDAAAFAGAAAGLADPKVRAPMAEAGRRAVIERYNWARDAATLVEAYRDLARS